jgi:hypothetical protein
MATLILSLAPQTRAAAAAVAAPRKNLREVRLGMAVLLIAVSVYREDFHVGCGRFGAYDNLRDSPLWRGFSGNFQENAFDFGGQDRKISAPGHAPAASQASR